VKSAGGIVFISDHDVHLIERTSDYCHPVGDDRFCLQIEEKYGIRLGQSARRRPKKCWVVSG